MSIVFTVEMLVHINTMIWVLKSLCNTPRAALINSLWFSRLESVTCGTEPTYSMCIKCGFIQMQTKATAYNANFGIATICDYGNACIWTFLLSIWCFLLFWSHHLTHGTLHCLPLILKGTAADTLIGLIKVTPNTHPWLIQGRITVHLCAVCRTQHP